MSAAHTPAPWEACDRGDYSDFDGNSQVILGDDMRIAVVHSSDEAGEANAFLIAAAPDLLAALRDMRSKYHRSLILGGSDPEFADLVCEGADQAIARATGAA